MTETMSKTEPDSLSEPNYFGDCPECGGNDGHLNVGRVHWFVCHKHKTRWSPGSNLMSGWRYEHKATHDRNLGILANHTKVEPWERFPHLPPEPYEGF